MTMRYTNPRLYFYISLLLWVSVCVGVCACDSCYRGCVRTVKELLKKKNARRRFDLGRLCFFHFHTFVLQFATNMCMSFVYNACKIINVLCSVMCIVYPLTLVSLIIG